MRGPFTPVAHNCSFSRRNFFVKIACHHHNYTHRLPACTQLLERQYALTSAGVVSTPEVLFSNFRICFLMFFNDAEIRAGER